MNDTRVGQREYCNTTIVVHMRSSASGFIGSSDLRIAMLSTIWAPRTGGIISDAPDASQCDAFGEKPGNWSDPESRFTQCLSSRQPTVEAPELHDPGSGRAWAALQCFVKATCSGDGIRSRLAPKARSEGSKANREDEGCEQPDGPSNGRAPGAQGIAKLGEIRLRGEVVALVGGGLAQHVRMCLGLLALDSGRFKGAGGGKRCRVRSKPSPGPICQSRPPPRGASRQGCSGRTSNSR